MYLSLEFPHHRSKDREMMLQMIWREFTFFFLLPVIFYPTSCVLFLTVGLFGFFVGTIQMEIHYLCTTLCIMICH